MHYKYALLNTLDLLKILDSRACEYLGDEDLEIIMGVRCSTENALAMLPVTEEGDQCCEASGDSGNDA